MLDDMPTRLPMPFREALKRFETLVQEGTEESAGAEDAIDWGIRYLDSVKEIESLVLAAIYSPEGDNHHNAKMCPYCSPERQ